MARHPSRRYPYATSFYIDLDTKNECKDLAASMSISESSLVRMLIRREYTERIGSRKPPQQVQEQVQA
jgi:hypothetical protein